MPEESGGVVLFSSPCLGIRKKKSKCGQGGWALAWVIRDCLTGPEADGKKKELLRKNKYPVDSSVPGMVLISTYKYSTLVGLWPAR